MLEKDYRFKDLPETHKQALIHLHQKANMPDINPLRPNKIKDFEDIFIKIKSLPTAELKRNIITISEYMQNISKNVNSDDIIEEIENKLIELSKKVDDYLFSLENPLFFEDLKEVYMMLSGRLLEIKARNKLKIFQ